METNIFAWSGPWEQFTYPYNRIDELWTAVHYLLFLFTPFIWGRAAYLGFKRAWVAVVVFLIALPSIIGALQIHPVWVSLTYAVWLCADYGRNRRFTLSIGLASIAAMSGLIWGILKTFAPGTKIAC